MGILSSTRSRSFRVGRNRRRAFFIAEVLETRQLLSVAAVHQMVAPVANVPALVGPAVPSPVAGVGSTGATAGATQQVQVVLEIIPVTINVGGGSGVTQGFFIVGESF